MLVKIKQLFKLQKRHRSHPIFAIAIALLFLVSSVTTVTSQQPQKSNRAIDKFVTVYGQKIHYVEAGRGPTIILLHGLGVDLSQWHNLISPLSKKHRVIALDQIGHGQSGRPFINYRTNTLVDFLRGFYKELKIDRATLVGESLGGAAAAAFAIAYPQQVDRLVLVDAGYGYALPEVSDQRLLGHRPGTLHLLNPSTREEARQLLALVTYNKQTIANEANVDEIFAATMRSSFTIQRFIESFARREDVLDNRLQTLNLPTLIIWGRQDILSPLPLGERFNREIAGSQLVVIDNCGHAPPNECPTKFNTTVMQFLDRTNPSSLAQSSGKIADQPQRGTLEVVAELPIRPWNHAVTREGRIFATVVRSMREQPALIEITGRNRYKPFPNAAWNATFGSSSNVFNRPQGIQIDEQNRLWVIDQGSWTILPDQGRPPLPDQRPKLLAFDINTGNLVYRFDFDDAIAPISKALPQDLAVDERHGFVYLADVGTQLPAAIIAVDLKRNTARRFEAHPSLKSENVDLVVEGKVLGRADATSKFVPARVGVNPISLSADRETLFYGAMTGTSLWSIPARLFREATNDTAIAAAVKRVGPKPVSDGISTDVEGNHYITNLGENAIDVLTPTGRLSHLVQDARLIWSDSLSFGEPTWLYVAVNQLNRSLLNAETDTGKPPYLIVRVWTGTQGVPGR